MTSASTSKVRENLSETLNRVAYGGERVILKRQGKPVAAIVSVEDAEMLERLEEKLDLEAARKAMKEKGKVSWTKVKKALGL